MKYNYRDNFEEEGHIGSVFDDVPVETHAKYRILGALFWIAVLIISIFVGTHF